MDIVDEKIEQKIRIRVTVECVLVLNDKVYDARQIGFREFFLTTIQDYLDQAQEIINVISNPFYFLRNKNE